MNSEKTCILNVDDYPPGLYARTRVLRQAGFDVLEATSGKETLRLASEHVPALILLDVNLPDIHGFEVCKRMRAIPTLATTTILHISASSIQDQEQARGLNTGADGYLVEPVDPAVLLATIRAFLRVRNAESALRRSNEDLERFAYRVSHELNEPLRTISMYSQLLENGLAGKIDENEQKCLDFVQDGARRMRAFIDDLLRYSQATHAGALVGLIDMEDTLAGAIRALGAAIQDSGATITHDPLPSVIADSRIEQVLQNLIGNAIKYCRKSVPPKIHVSAAIERNNYRFAVRDNGIGIESRYFHSIFQVFERLHGSDIPGSGIGLALSKKIVETNGGTMWLESEPGSGSTFYFTVRQSGGPQAN